MERGVGKFHYLESWWDEVESGKEKIACTINTIKLIKTSSLHHFPNQNSPIPLSTWRGE
jgi:hypothetical protein